MKRVLNEKMVVILGATLLFIFGFTQPVFAYLDPGSGSAILQGLIAGFVAIGVVAKLYWHRILKKLGFRKDIESAKK